MPAPAPPPVAVNGLCGVDSCSASITPLGDCSYRYRPCATCEINDMTVPAATVVNFTPILLAAPLDSSWTAIGGGSYQCLAVIGACGTANGTTVATAPSSGPCSAGTETVVTGSSGGSSASCSAPLSSLLTVGSCGPTTPNGGFIKMPGAFHTEVVPVGQNKLKVFLLDMNWKNPSILNSNLSVTHKASGTTTAMRDTDKLRFSPPACRAAANIDTTMIIEPEGTHNWFEESPVRILN